MVVASHLTCSYQETRFSSAIAAGRETRAKLPIGVSAAIQGPKVRRPASPQGNMPTMALRAECPIHREAISLLRIRSGIWRAPTTRSFNPSTEAWSLSPTSRLRPCFRQADFSVLIPWILHSLLPYFSIGFESYCGHPRSDRSRCAGPAPPTAAYSVGFWRSNMVNSAVRNAM